MLGIHPELRHALAQIEDKIDQVQQTPEGHGDNEKRNQGVSDRGSLLSPVNVDHGLDSEQVGGFQMPGSNLLILTFSLLGESPPPPPRACFGRDELVKSVVGLAENLNPIALTGAGGIGKTSIALTVLHHDRIKERFGENRRFIRCDQFPASQVNFLNRLSKAIGAGVENPEDLTPLRPFLSSKEMLVVLDNAESILDPQGVDGLGIYHVVEELSQFANIWLIITSRITTIPPNCETLEIPTLSMEAGHDTFYRIYKRGGRSDSANKILKQLDFHPLSVTLLATAAHQNGWDNGRLAREWDKRRTGALRTKHNQSLAATIELSLASPMFQKLGPDARELLAIVAFFPEGVDENNLDWLFPTISDRSTIFDEFYTLSLTYRSNGFITMLVPLRDYLCPEDPLSSPLLCAAREHYFTRLSAKINPNAPGFKETRWIASEDANVEHLLNVLMSTDTNSDEVWRACANFLRHLYWHKPRQTVLGPKIEGLPDDHPSKPRCLLGLAKLFQSIGNCREQKRLLEYSLRLKRERGNGSQVAFILIDLSDANRVLGLFKEGIGQAREALEIYDRVGGAGSQQGQCLVKLAMLLHEDKQLEAAEEAASRAIKILPEKGQEYRVCRSHRVLGSIYRSKGEKEKAIHHYETALTIASSFGWNDLLFWVHLNLALLFRGMDDLHKAHAHIEQATSYAVDYPYLLGRGILLQAQIYYGQQRLEDSASGAQRALEIFERLGAQLFVEDCEGLLREIEQATKS